MGWNAPAGDGLALGREPSRSAFVVPDRIEGWAGRFLLGHGGGSTARTDGGLLLSAADGAAALLAPPWPDDGRPGRGADDLQRLAALAGQSRSYGLLLLRRGGYGLGLCREGQLREHKTGSRYVQSKTAAGGSSQHRYARRRAGQADALVATVAATAAALFASPPEYLVLGGDRALCQLVLAEPATRSVAALPRLPFQDVPDPRLAVLAQAARDASSIRVTVWDPPAP